MTLFFPAGLNVGGTYIGQASDQTVEQNPDELTEFAAGDWAPAFVGASREEPELSFNSTDLTGVLDLMSTSYLLRAMGAGTVNMFFRKATNLSTRVAHGTASHHVYSVINNCMWTWEQITAGQRDSARIETTITTTYNGTQRPITQLPDQTIDAPPNTLKLWTLGPIKVNGSWITRPKSMQWKNNCDILRDDANGNTAPDVAILRKVRPVVTIESSDLKVLSAFADGLAVTELIVYLRRRQDSLMNYADASAVHMKLTATAGSARFQRAASDPASGRLAIQVTKDSSGNFFTYTKDCAIA